jgi:16S rRNA G966 N2-methylase RsmD
VFLDPPYRLKFGEKLMQAMDELKLLEDRATVVLEYETSYVYPSCFGNFTELRKAEYGETAVSIYRYEP